MALYKKSNNKKTLRIFVCFLIALSEVDEITVFLMMLLGWAFTDTLLMPLYSHSKPELPYYSFIFLEYKLLLK